MDDAQAKLQDATGDIEEIEGKIEEPNKRFHYSTFFVCASPSSSVFYNAYNEHNKSPAEQIVPPGFY